MLANCGRASSARRCAWSTPSPGRTAPRSALASKKPSAPRRVSPATSRRRPPTEVVIEAAPGHRARARDAAAGQGRGRAAPRLHRGPLRRRRGRGADGVEVRYPGRPRRTVVVHSAHQQDQVSPRSSRCCRERRRGSLLPPQAPATSEQLAAVLPPCRFSRPPADGQWPVAVTVTEPQRAAWVALVARLHRTPSSPRSPRTRRSRACRRTCAGHHRALEQVREATALFGSHRRPRAARAFAARAAPARLAGRRGSRRARQSIWLFEALTEAGCDGGRRWNARAGRGTYTQVGRDAAAVGRARRVANHPDLAYELGSAERTVRRDLAALHAVCRWSATASSGGARTGRPSPTRWPMPRRPERARCIEVVTALLHARSRAPAACARATRRQASALLTRDGPLGCSRGASPLRAPFRGSAARPRGVARVGSARQRCRHVRPSPGAPRCSSSPHPPRTGDDQRRVAWSRAFWRAVKAAPAVAPMRGLARQRTDLHRAAPLVDRGLP